MSDYQQTYKRYLKVMLYILSVLVLGWGFTPYQTIFQGLILGTLLSLYNLWNMYRKIGRLGRSIAEGRKVTSLGSLTRLLTAGLAVLISLRYPQWFHLGSVIIGLMTTYLIMLIYPLLHTIRFRKEKR